VNKWEVKEKHRNSGFGKGFFRGISHLGTGPCSSYISSFVSFHVLFTRLPWRWRQYVPPKCLYTSVTLQNVSITHPMNLSAYNIFFFPTYDRLNRNSRNEFCRKVDKCWWTTRLKMFQNLSTPTTQREQCIYVCHMSLTENSDYFRKHVNRLFGEVQAAVLNMYVCVRGGPNQPLHRDPHWSIVLSVKHYLDELHTPMGQLSHICESAG
jgi:hypothetical protein